MKAFGALAALCLALPGQAAPCRMDRSRLQIGAYCLAPYARTEAHVRDLRDCGIDFVYGVPAEDRATLDLCAKYGVGVIATGAVPFWHGMGGEQAGRMKVLRPIASYEAALSRYVDHPAVWMLDYVDEPSALDFPQIAEVTRLMLGKSPTGVLPYINLYPNYASVVGNTAQQAVNQLGTRTYAEHVEAYMKNVPLDYVCFDYYVYSARGRDAFARKLEKFHENLKDLADACRRYGKSLWFIPQVNSSYGELWLSENMLRFQAHLAMAYGAEQIDWACWSREDREEDPDMPGLIGWWTNNVLDLSGARTQQYEKLKKVNAELHALGERYMRYRNIGTRRIGENAFTVGDMVARDGSGRRALFVVACGDPMDERPVVQTFSYLAADGEHKVEIAANHAALIEYEPVFSAAEPVWHKGHETEMNEQLVFRGNFSCANGDRPVLKIASSNPYRVTLNGDFAWYGPQHGPKGSFRVDEIPLAAKSGANVLEIECAGYNCASFYWQKQPSFIEAEVSCEGDVLLRTAAVQGPGTFTARPSARVRKVSRYSHARPFGEAYELPAKGDGVLELARMPEVSLLPRRAPTPDFSVADDFRPVAGGACAYDKESDTTPIGFVDAAGADGTDGFPRGELKFDLWREQQRFRPEPGTAPEPAAGYALKAGRYLRFESPVNRTGFPMLAIRCEEPGELHVLMDECPVPGEFKPWRSKVANDVAWVFDKPGEYAVEAFEPYVFRVVETVAKSGRFVVSAPKVRLFRNAESRRVRFSSSDRDLERLFAAAEETFAQNGVDGFLDCPGRERAQWNCDAFFTSRASALLTGNLVQETSFFENFALPPHFDNVERGMIPMCYPADFATGNYIPSWAMFFVLQLEEYARLRGGDRAVAESLRPRVFALVEFLSRYRNRDGLLERLPRWVFVEWSKANDFVRDVNYPNNMIWAATLDAVDRLYGRPDLAAEAERIRDTIRRQSWTGEWFCDNALRQEDGTLRLSGECSETCQYYAFYFGVASRASHRALYDRLVGEFGPRRDAARVWPRIYPSAPFIGAFMRLDWLGREDLVSRQCQEMKGYFLDMSNTTGTLWENADSSDNGSCCHGFASHVAVFVIRDIVGVKAVDTGNRVIDIRPPSDVQISWCSLKLPVGDEVLDIGWRRDGERVSVQLPKGWRGKNED